MPDLVLSFAMTPYDRVMPLISGDVKPSGITLEYQGMPGGAPGTFYDLLKFQRFDLSEMSFSSFLRSRADGWPYRMLPVFHNRNFYYTTMLIRQSAGIRQDHPGDLKGKRVGVMDYPQSAALWIRGVLQHEFDVHPTDMTWYQERGRHFSHGGATGFVPPPGLTLHYATRDFGTMYLSGELDASMGFVTPPESTVDRKRASIAGNPDFTTLFADPKAEAIRYFRKNGIFPAQHTTVVRESILEQHPWVAISLMEAFERAKQVARERLQRYPPSLLVFGPEETRLVREVFGNDPYPYGFQANARLIDMVQTISVEQGLTHRKQPWEELFAEESLLMEERNSPGGE